MTVKRILLIESGMFIGGVIHNLFSSHEHLMVIEAAPINSCELLKAVREHKPHIVVMDDTLNVDYLNNLLNFMQDSPDLSVVVVNTESNRVEVYQKQQIDVRKSADLFAIL
jgi:DNA-binding NarL/FixJ family response regulator